MHLVDSTRFTPISGYSQHSTRYTGLCLLSCAVGCALVDSNGKCPEHRMMEVQIDDISKVESYFGRVQQANIQFTEKLLSYFDDVVSSACNTPRHLVMALRVVLNQEVVWGRLQESAEANPWGVVYRTEATARMQQGIAKHLKPVCHEAERVCPRACLCSMCSRDRSLQSVGKQRMMLCLLQVSQHSVLRPLSAQPFRTLIPGACCASHCGTVDIYMHVLVCECLQVFAKWMQTHGRAAPVLFQQAAKSNGPRRSRTSNGGSSPPGSISSSSDGGAPRFSTAGANFLLAPEISFMHSLYEDKRTKHA